MSDDIHEVYAVRYAEHARMRSENYIFGDPHDEMTSIAYYVWVIKGPHGVFVCDTGGVGVRCAGNTGYTAVADLRYLWMRQKRLQGSHFANDEQSYAFNQLVVEGKIDPCLARTNSFKEIPECHQAMYENRAPEGKMVALVGAPHEGLKDLDA